jgi:hypothetical protein
MKPRTMTQTIGSLNIVILSSKTTIIRIVGSIYVPGNFVRQGPGKPVLTTRTQGLEQTDLELS